MLSLDGKLIENKKRKIMKKQIITLKMTLSGWFILCVIFIFFMKSASGQITAKFNNDQGIKSNSDVILSTNFDNPNWMEEWNNWGGGNTVVTDANDKENFIPLDRKALQVTVPEGEHSGMSMIYRFLEQTGAEPEEVYFRYYIRLGDNWSPTSDGKFPGIAGTYGKAGWGGRIPNGYDGWSVRGLFGKATSEGTPIGFYSYHLDDSNRKWGDHLYWNEPENSDKRAYLKNNRWYCIEMYVKLNTPKEYDGILRGWIDGKSAFERTNMRFRDTTDLKIETIWMNLYHGGSVVAPADQFLFIDNIVVARDYNGTIYY